MRRKLKKVLISWSGGKDSAFALQQLLRDDNYEVVALLTTVTAGYDRISMHGVRKALLESQAESLGYPLVVVLIPQECTNEEYEQRMGAVLEKYIDLGIEGVVFGDLFLEDVRSYREERLAQVGLKGIFPIWNMPTSQVAHEFIERGFRAVVVCVDTQMLPGEYLGREYDQTFLADLPDHIDPCGENGEFHTFVYDGPPFMQSVDHIPGEKVMREGRFYYCDLHPLHEEADKRKGATPC